MSGGRTSDDGRRAYLAPLAAGFALVLVVGLLDLLVRRDALLPSLAAIAVVVALLVGHERRRFERERAAGRRTELLARVGLLLEAERDPAQMLAEITDLVLPELGDLAVVDELGEDGHTLRTTVTSAVREEYVAAIRESRGRFPVPVDGPHPIAVAFRSREAVLLPAIPDERLREMATSEEHVALLRRSRYRSAMALPLVARGRILGVLSYLRIADERPYTPEDLQLGRDLAAGAALALDNARLLRDVGAAEARLEAIVGSVGEAVVALSPDGTLVFANPAAAALAGAGSPDELLALAVEELAPRFTLLDEDGRPVPIAALPPARALRGEAPEPLVTRSVDRTTGRDRWFVLRAEPLHDPSGALQLVVAVVEDVTAIKREETRQRLLADASKLVGSSLDLPATLDKAAWAVVPELADWARLDLLDERGALTEAAVAHRDLERLEVLREWRRRYPLERSDERNDYEVLRTGRSVVWAEVRPEDVEAFARDAEHARLMREIDTRSMLIVPLVAGEETLGTLQLATTGESARRLGDGDVDLAEELARRVALAIANARLHAQRTHIATTLQRSLLPPRLPVVPGLTIAARFRAAGPASDVGGDFYDLFPARGGWMLAMGDVTGKGPGAAAITSIARHTMRTAATYEDDPVAIVERLNAALVGDAERRQICTAVCVLVREREGAVTLRLTCAGHPSPLLVRDGVVRAVGPAGTLLGAFPQGRWSTEAVALDPGDTLVLYTDGVTDTRGEEGRFGTERLVALLERIGPRPPDEVAAQIDLALQAFGEQRDDVALLVLQADPGEQGQASIVAAEAQEERSRPLSRPSSDGDGASSGSGSSAGGSA